MPLTLPILSPSSRADDLALWYEGPRIFVGERGDTLTVSVKVEPASVPIGPPQGNHVVISMKYQRGEEVYEAKGPHMPDSITWEAALASPVLVEFLRSVGILPVTALRGGMLRCFFCYRAPTIIPSNPWTSLQKPDHIDFLLFLQKQAALLTAHTEGAGIASLEMGDPNRGEWLFFLRPFSLREKRILFTVFTEDDQKIGIRPANSRDTTFYDSSEAAKQGFCNMVAGVRGQLSPVWIIGAMIQAQEKSEKEAEREAEKAKLAKEVEKAMAAKTAS